MRERIKMSDNQTEERYDDNTGEPTSDIVTEEIDEIPEEFEIADDYEEATEEFSEEESSSGSASLKIRKEVS